MCYRCTSGQGGYCTDSGEVTIPRTPTGQMAVRLTRKPIHRHQPHMLTGQVSIRQPANADTPRRTVDCGQFSPPNRGVRDQDLFADCVGIHEETVETMMQAASEADDLLIDVPLTVTG